MVWTAIEPQTLRKADTRKTTAREKAIKYNSWAHYLVASFRVVPLWNAHICVGLCVNISLKNKSLLLVQV